MGRTASLIYSGLWLLHGLYLSGYLWVPQKLKYPGKTSKQLRARKKFFNKPAESLKLGISVFACGEVFGCLIWVVLLKYFISSVPLVDGLSSCPDLYQILLPTSN